MHTLYALAVSLGCFLLGIMLKSDVRRNFNNNKYELIGLFNSCPPSTSPLPGMYSGIWALLWTVNQQKQSRTLRGHSTNIFHTIIDTKWSKQTYLLGLRYMKKIKISPLPTVPPHGLMSRFGRLKYSCSLYK